MHHPDQADALPPPSPPPSSQEEKDNASKLLAADPDEFLVHGEVQDLLEQLMEMAPSDEEEEEEDGNGNGNGNANPRARYRHRRNWLEKQRMHAMQRRIRAMQTTVKQLECQFETLCQQADHARTATAANHSQPDHQQADVATTPNHTYVWLFMNQRVETIDSTTPSLHALAQEIHFLTKDNARLRDLIEQNQHFQHLIAWMTTETVRLPTMQRPNVNSPRAFVQTGRFGLIPFTQEECQAVVRRDFAQHVLQTKRQSVNDKSTLKQLPLGWSGFFILEGASTTRFRMTKTWPGTPKTICNKLWKYLITENDPIHVHCEPYCVEILQHVSDDIKVVRRRIAWKGWVIWSVCLMYRARVRSSCVIGCVPLPLWGNGKSVDANDQFGKSFLHSRETMAILPMHCLLESGVGSNGEAQTQVNRWGSGSCDQVALFMPLFKQCTLECMLRLEQLVLFPIVSKPLAGC